MIPGMNPRDLQRAMKQLGIKQEEIPATEVIIRTTEKEIIITNPNVAKVNMMGQDSFQITGQVHERARDSTPTITEEDVQTVRAQTGCSAEQAKAVLAEQNGDLAAAILALQNR